MAVETTLNTISSGYNRSNINSNFEEIATALNDALSRSGNAPNSMEADLDLNNNDLLNAGLVETDRLLVGGEEFVASEAVAVGPAGEAATITVGTVTTGAAGTSVIVTNVGDETNAIFDITIPRGDTGASGAGSGDMVAAQNLNDVADKPTAFSNIKQAASTSATGVVEIATAAEYRTGTDTVRTLGISEVWSAAGFVTITDSATLTFDMSTWLSLIQTTLAGNRTVGDPTNVKPGQHFMWKLTATGSTRTFTLHADFKVATGIEPFPLSITTSETVYVYGFAESTNVIRVTSVQRFA